MQALQVLIDVADKIRTATDKKGLIGIVTQNRKEVSALKDLVAIVEGQPPLQTKAILEEVDGIAEQAEKLEELLTAMESGSFSVRLRHGPSQKEELTALTGNIAKAKSNLTMKIQSAHVGLTILFNDRFVVQMDKLEAVEQTLKQMMVGFEGLLIRHVVEGKELSEDGTVALDKSDLEQLGLEAEGSGVYRDGSRYIDNNLALDQSFMINGTIGTEGFIEPKHVRIFNNTTRHQASMVNVSTSTEQMQAMRNERLEIIKVMAAAGTLQNVQPDPERMDVDGMREGRAERALVRSFVNEARKNVRNQNTEAQKD
ncbi:hypothetical protein BJY04DRAFT_224374 [Aspergillus karnatakaensis]|uniref:uncharacterized protein n=1 Tax=Aspergillus karnatakaensis TaxID=1810916 RepID=UPI003CCD91E6